MSYIKASFREKTGGCTVTSQFPAEPHQSNSLKSKVYSFILLNKVFFFLVCEWFLLHTCSTPKHFFCSSPEHFTCSCEWISQNGNTWYFSEWKSIFFNKIHVCCCHWLCPCKKLESVEVLLPEFHNALPSLTSCGTKLCSLIIDIVY